MSGRCLVTCKVGQMSKELSRGRCQCKEGGLVSSRCKGEGPVLEVRWCCCRCNERGLVKKGRGCR